MAIFNLCTYLLVQIHAEFQTLGPWSSYCSIKPTTHDRTEHVHAYQDLSFCLCVNVLWLMPTMKVLWQEAHQQYSLFFHFAGNDTLFHYTPPAISNLMTVLPAVLVPACAVIIVATVIAATCVMRKKSVAMKPRDGIDMISANREETEAGLVDLYIVKPWG